VHLTRRTGIGGVLAVIGALAVSCQSRGSGCNTSPGPYNSPTLVLASRYVLTDASGPHAGFAAIPAFYGDSAGFRLRVDADTLTFNADSTYREAGLTEQVVATTRVHASSTPLPTFHPGTGGGGTLILPSFMGRTAIAQYGADQLTVYTPAGTDPYGGPAFHFVAR
jgi:hypothetical protein